MALRISASCPPGLVRLWRCCKMAAIGIDCGSAACKGVLMQDGVIAGRLVRPTGWSPRETSRQMLEQLLEEHGLMRSDTAVVVTGYGRVGIDFADRAVTEITCHASGANYLLPGVRTVIDIGGQDSKVIAVEHGKVTSFQMNDKCAAGTGRFLEMTAIRLGVTFPEFEVLLEANQSCTINSMCAVFADSEIVSLLASGKSREEIAGGIIASVAARAAALTARIPLAPAVLLTGGLSGMAGLRAALSDRLNLPIEASPDSLLAGAIGAALMAGGSALPVL